MGKNKVLFFILFMYLFIWPRHSASGILVPGDQTQWEQSLNHWTAREVSKSSLDLMEQ